MFGEQNQNKNQLNEGLLKQILEKIGVQWGRYFDVFPRKLMSHYLALPYNDILGVFSKTSNTLADILFGGKGFKIKIKHGMINMGGAQTVVPNQENPLPSGTEAVQHYIDSNLFGKNAFRENLRRHFVKMLIYGNMVTTVGRGEQGPEVRFTDGLSCFEIDSDETGVTKMATVNFKIKDVDTMFAIVNVDGLYYRLTEIYQIQGGALGAKVNFGSPDWMWCFGATPMQEANELPLPEFGHKKSQWWRLPTETVLHANTPYTDGILNNIPAYREILKVYLQLKKEIGWKLPVLFYNKTFQEPEFKSIGVMNSFESLKSSGNPTVWANPSSRQDSFNPSMGMGFAMGMYPNSDMFPDFRNLFAGLDTNYSPMTGIKSKEQDCVYKTLMDKNKLLEMWDPPIRDASFVNILNLELGKLGTVHRLGERFFQYQGTDKGTAAQALMGDRDLLNLVTQLETYCERPIKELVLAYCDYAAVDGYINIYDVPQTLDDIQIIWDNHMLMDDNLEKSRMISAMGSVLSRQYICRHVFNMSEEEIQKNNMELLADPIAMSQMQQQNEMTQHINDGAYGYLGASPTPAPIGKKNDNTAVQANTGKGKVGEKTTGGEK